MERIHQVIESDAEGLNETQFAGWNTQMHSNASVCWCVHDKEIINSHLKR